MEMKPGLYSCRSSGSTGQPVKVEKNIFDYIWYNATNIRELRWKRWNVSKNLAVIRPNFTGRSEMPSWGFPKQIYPKQGKMFKNNYTTISELQKWLEEVNPHYLHTYPSIIRELDLSKITNLIDVKGTGEKGGSMYSSEECGTIAIQCPHNPSNYHVMENQIVETDEEGNAIITTITNPYIKRYKIGDIITLGKCTCGRTLQTITEIHGRVRNMLIMPDGNKKWPLVGSRLYYEKYGIKRFKCIQKSLQELELQIIVDCKVDEIELKKDVLDAIGYEMNIDIVYVDGFPNYKHEEFVCMLSK